MRIARTREQQQQTTQERRKRASQLARIGLTHKQIAERLGVAGSTVAHLLAECAEYRSPAMRRRNGR